MAEDYKENMARRFVRHTDLSAEELAEMPRDVLQAKAREFFEGGATGNDPGPTQMRLDAMREGANAQAATDLSRRFDSAFFIARGKDTLQVGRDEEGFTDRSVERGNVEVRRVETGPDTTMEQLVDRRTGQIVTQRKVT